MDAAGGGMEAELLPWPVLGSGDAGDDTEHASPSSDVCPEEAARLTRMELINREGATWAESAAEVRALAARARPTLRERRAMPAHAGRGSRSRAAGQHHRQHGF